MCPDAHSLLPTTGIAGHPLCPLVGALPRVTLLHYRSLLHCHSGTCLCWHRHHRPRLLALPNRPLQLHDRKLRSLRAVHVGKQSRNTRGYRLTQAKLSVTHWNTSGGREISRRIKTSREHRANGRKLQLFKANPELSTCMYWLSSHLTGRPSISKQ